MMTISKDIIALHFSLMPLDPPRVMLWLRVTARISGILLATSFASLALSRLWPSPFILWMAANRHRFTLLFALSHTLHLAGAVTLATLLPDQFLSKKGLPVLIVGGVAYALIYYMAWTAFTRRKKPRPAGWDDADIRAVSHLGGLHSGLYYWPLEKCVDLCAAGLGYVVRICCACGGEVHPRDRFPKERMPLEATSVLKSARK